MSKLKRLLKIPDLFAIGYADLGSSIYYALGITALFALGATPISFAIAGVVFFCTALAYAELSSMYQEAGGTASFARYAFNDLVSFIAGWGLLLDYIVTIAISAFAVGPYLGIFYPALKKEIVISFTVSLILLLLIMNVLGIRKSTRISLYLTAATLLTQIVIVVIGAGWLLDLDTVIDHMRIGVPGASWSPTWPEFWKGTAMAMVAYTGIESMAQLGAETNQPKRNVPKAMIIVMIVHLTMYFGISFVALSAISPNLLSTEYVNDPIAGIIAYLPFGKEFLGPWTGIFVAFLLFVAANAGLIGASRLAHNMGDHKQLPAFFFRTHSRFGTPYVALIIFAALAALLVIVSQGELAFIADLYNFGAMIAFFFANVCVLVLRVKKPNAERRFRISCNIPFGKHRLPLTAIIGSLGTLAVWCLIVITKPNGRYLGLGWLAAGLIIYILYRRKQKLGLLQS